MTMIQTKGTGVSEVPAGTKLPETATSSEVRIRLERQMSDAQERLRNFSRLRDALDPKLRRATQSDSIEEYKRITGEIKRLEEEFASLLDAEQ